jgi:hypothetical protein
MQGKQLPPSFASVRHWVRAPYHKLSRGIKPGFNILNLNSSINWRNGTIHHLYERAHSRMCHQLEQSRLQSSEKRKVLFLSNLLPGGTAVNSDHYTGTLKTLYAHLCSGCHTRRMSALLLLQTNATPHTSVCTAITNFGQTMSLHLPYSPLTLVLSYHLFWPLKKACKDTVTPMTMHWHNTMCQGVRERDSSFYLVENTHVQRWKKTVNKDGNHSEK